jgi:hypothetical protein
VSGDGGSEQPWVGDIWDVLDKKIITSYKIVALRKTVEIVVVQTY